MRDYASPMSNVGQPIVYVGGPTNIIEYLIIQYCMSCGFKTGGWFNWYWNGPFLVLNSGAGYNPVGGL